MQPSMSEFLFSAKGRISRSQFWLKWALPVIVLTVVLEIICFSIFDPTMVSVVIGIYSLVLLWPSIAIYIKRAHDRGRSGSFVLLFLVPVVSLWPLIELLFLPGTNGANEYGPDPLAMS
jgi:uncharacterized membrane protein YhaH (DUF805 family)